MRYYTFFRLTKLKLIIDFNPLLIGAEGAKTPAGVRGRGDPTGAIAPRRLPEPPAESEAPGAQINRQVSKNAYVKGDFFSALVKTRPFLYSVLS